MKNLTDVFPSSSINCISNLSALLTTDLATCKLAMGATPPGRINDSNGVSSFCIVSISCNKVSLAFCCNNTTPFGILFVGHANSAPKSNNSCWILCIIRCSIWF